MRQLGPLNSKEGAAWAMVYSSRPAVRILLQRCSRVLTHAWQSTDVSPGCAGGRSPGATVLMGKALGPFSTVMPLSDPPLIILFPGRGSVLEA